MECVVTAAELEQAVAEALWQRGACGPCMLVIGETPTRGPVCKPGHHIAAARAAISVTVEACLGELYNYDLDQIQLRMEALLPKGGDALTVQPNETAHPSRLLHAALRDGGLDVEDHLLVFFPNHGKSGIGVCCRSCDFIAHVADAGPASLVRGALVCPGVQVLGTNGGTEGV